MMVFLIAMAMGLNLDSIEVCVLYFWIGWEDLDMDDNF